MENDYELLYLAKEEPEVIVEILYKKYRGIIYSKALKYSAFNLPIEDLINEAKIALHNAIDTYQDKYNFNTYLNKCIDNHLCNYKKASIRNKNKILNEAVSMDNVDYLELKYDDINDPEKIIFKEYDYECFKNKIIDKLNWKEELVFILIAENYSNKEISQITDNSLRTVYNIINRIKNKVSNLMSSNNN